MAKKPVTIASDKPLDEAAITAPVVTSEVTAAPDTSLDDFGPVVTAPKPIEPVVEAAVEAPKPPRLSPQTVAEMARGKAAISVYG